jgi:RNA polymerase sigma-70 factor (ECF subfamily)
VSLTSRSLLDRLKNAAPDAPEWHRLHTIYLPLIQYWLRRVAGVGDEADDLAQEVLIVLVCELPAFERRRDGSFRTWLRGITLNRIRAFQRTRRKLPLAGGEDDALLSQLADSASDIARQWDREHDKHVFQKLTALVKGDFEPNTWEAFTLFALDERPAAEVAEKLGLTESAVVQAKCRILKRLREEAGELLD